MKVTGIRHEKHKCDGDGTTRIIIDYEIGDKSKTATMYGDVFTGEAKFGGNAEFMNHVVAHDALVDIAEAAMVLAYYGWEG